MGFFATIGRGWQMSKLSLSVIRKDPELIVYMMISAVFALACMIGIGLPQYMEMSWAVDAEGVATGAYLGYAFVGYMLMTIIVTFWNCAIVANANIRLTGGDPTFGDGIREASKHLPAIIAWGIVAGTVGLLLKFLEGAARSSDNDAMKTVAVIVHFIGAAIWWAMTFFMLPFLVIEGKSLGDSLKSSKDTFFATWGENITSGLGIGLIAFLFAIPLIAITIMLAVVMPLLGLIFGAFAFGLLIAITSTAEQVAVVALYRFAKDGQMPQIYQSAGVMTYNFGNAQTV